MTYTVDGDRSVLKLSLPVPMSSDRRFDTIDHLFATLKQYLSRKPFRAEIYFDPALGFPSRGGFEDDANTTDDEWGFQVTEFKVIAR